jgi:hypothetical protein
MESALLLERGAAFRADNSAGIRSELLRLAADPAVRAAAGDAGAAVAADSAGSARRTFDALRAALEL